MSRISDAILKPGPVPPMLDIVQCGPPGYAPPYVDLYESVEKFVQFFLERHPEAKSAHSILQLMPDVLHKECEAFGIGYVTNLLDYFSFVITNGMTEEPIPSMTVAEEIVKKRNALRAAADFMAALINISVETLVIGQNKFIETMTPYPGLGYLEPLVIPFTSGEEIMNEIEKAKPVIIGMDQGVTTDLSVSIVTGVLTGIGNIATNCGNLASASWATYDSSTS